MHEPDPCGAGTRVSSQPAPRAATAAFAYGYGVPRGAAPTKARTGPLRRWNSRVLATRDPGGHRGPPLRDRGMNPGMNP